MDHEPAHAEQPTGPESVKQTVRRLHDAFGGLRFEVQDEIAEGDKVVQLVIMSGRHTGSFVGREPTGQEFTWRIAGDQIVEHWEVGMTSAFSRSLGVSRCMRSLKPASSESAST